MEIAIPELGKDIVLLFVRLLLAITFFYEAKVKFKDIKGFAKSHGIPAPLASFVAFAELLAGISMLLGYLTQLAAIGIIILMLNTLYMQIFSWKSKYWASKQGPEYDLIQIAFAAVILVFGAGAFSIEALL